jgi:hypothetical protein
MSELAHAFKFNLTIPFTEIKADDIGSATHRYFMQWGEFKLKRITHTPYGSNGYGAVWSLNDTIISDLTFENGNVIAQFFEDKWKAETNGKSILIENNKKW